MDVPALSVYALPGTWWSWLLWQIWKFLQGSRSLSEGSIMYLTAIVFKGQEKKLQQILVNEENDFLYPLKNY